VNPKRQLTAPRVVVVQSVLEATPKYLLEEARLRFEEIAEGVKDIPEGGAFWTSVRESRLCLVVHGWSFFYTFQNGMLRVTEVRSPP
jgi:hypothetical protein